MNDNMKVLSVHWGFSPGGVGKYALLIDGVSNYAPIIIKSLCVLQKDWPCDSRGLSALNADKVFIRSRLDFSWVKAVLNSILSYSPDLIITHGFNGHFVAWLTKLYSGHRIKLFTTYHGRYHATTMGRRLFELVINRFTEFYIKKISEKTISVSEYSKRYLLDKKVSPNKITVIHNGISSYNSDLNSREKLRKDWGIDDDQIILGATSRLDPVKGLEYMVNAFIEIAHKHKKIFLVIIGEGKKKRALQAQVSEAGLSDRVLFTGFRSDVTDCLSAFDIFVLPSLAEYHSIALLEAMQAGKAIVATDVGGNIESVRHEKEGLIVLPADSASLKAAIERYIKDTEFALAMGENAKTRFYEYFTVDVMVKKTAVWMINAGFLK